MESNRLQTRVGSLAWQSSGEGPTLVFFAGALANHKGPPVRLPGDGASTGRRRCCFRRRGAASTTAAISARMDEIRWSAIPAGRLLLAWGVTAVDVSGSGSWFWQ
jgi:hypothetical protein